MNESSTTFSPNPLFDKKCYFVHKSGFSWKRQWNYGQTFCFLVGIRLGVD